MSTPPDEPRDESSDTSPGTPSGSESEIPFDPYRFGKPDHPIPPEYAPPGYAPPAPSVGAGTPTGHAPYGWNYGPQHGAPNRHEYAQPHTGNGKAIASMVLGIASIVLCWLSLFDAVLVVTGIVLGIVALNEGKRRDGAGRAMAITGLVCATIGAVAATLITVYYLNVVNKCGGLQNSRDPRFQQCIRDNA